MSEPTGGPPSPPDPPSAPPPPPPPPSDPPSAGSPPPPPPPAAGSSNKGLMIVLSYLGLLALIPLLMEKDDEEVQWHAKHGLVLFVAGILLYGAVAVFGMMLSMTGMDFGCGCLLPMLVGLAWMIVLIVCIVKGVNGQRFIVPGISQFADKF